MNIPVRTTNIVRAVEQRIKTVNQDPQLDSDVKKLAAKMLAVTLKAFKDIEETMPIQMVPEEDFEKYGLVDFFAG